MNNDDYDKIEDELITEDRNKHKEKMPVSGRSVFEILRLKTQKTEKRENKNEED